MTQPQVTGSPDYRSYPQWRTKNLFPALAQVIAPGPSVTGPVALTAWQSLTVQVRCSTGYGNVIISWYTDAAGTQLIGTDQFPFNNACGVLVTSPCRGMYATITIDNTSAVNADVTSYAFASNNATNSFYYPVHEWDIFQLNGNVPAGSTITYTAPWIFNGPAMLYFEPKDTSGMLFVYAAAYDGSGMPQGTVANIGTPAVIVSQQVTIPPWIIGVGVQNNDALNAHPYNLSLIGQT